MNLGGGANAATRAQMTYVANDPLFELVWSPYKGLILRCAVGSVPNKKSSFSCGAGPADMVLSPLHTIGTEANHDKLAEGRNSIPRRTASKDVACEAAAQSIPLESGGGNKPACKSGDRLESGLEDGRLRNFSSESNDHLHNATPVPGDFPDRKICASFDQSENNGQAHSLLPIKGSSPQGTGDLRKSMDALMLQASSQCNGHHQSNTFNKEDGENKMTTPSSSSALPLDKLECVAENDLQPSGKFVSASALEIGDSLHDKEQLQLEVYEISKASPITALASERKGKEKAMSDEDLKKEASKEDGDSYESYESSESCNSAGMFSAGKKRVLSFEEQLIVGSKRLKMQVQEANGSAFFTRSNSSFANWISTMIMGLPRSDEDGPSLAHPDDRNEKKEPITCSREQDTKCGSMGFQSLFQSLYQPSPKVQVERLLSSDKHLISEDCKELKLTNNSTKGNDSPLISNQDDLMALKQKIVSNESMGQSAAGASQGPLAYKDLKLTNNSSEGNNSPLMSNPDDLMALKQTIVSNESRSQSARGASQDPLVHPTVLRENVAYVPLDCKNGVSAKRFSLFLDSTMARDVGCSQNFIEEKKTAAICPDLPSAAKQVHASANRDSHLNSLLFTHFCPKSSRSIMGSAQSRQGPAGTLERAATTTLICKSQYNIDCFEDKKNVESHGDTPEEPTNLSGKKLNNFPLDVEASCTIRKIEGQNGSQKSRSSEPMVSLFAKRLDALKHIMPTDFAEISSSSTTCFFCGIIGHELRNCPQVTATEVDKLLMSITAYGGAEESPCLCIRCLQLDHWAASCPNAPSRKKHQLKDGAMWHQKRFEKNLSLPDDIDGESQVLRVKTGCASSPGCFKPPRVTTNLQVNLEMKESLASIGKISSNLQNNNAASSEENASKLPGCFYQCRPLPRHVLDIPTGIFEAVKSLQLSRTDIMKWTNSMLSLSLDGYYLRLRLGKLGEGLGGTAYQVACIFSAQGGKLAETSKRPISVVVGGIRCSVESQYISNQDFLEDELKAWWSATLRRDGKIPSEDELRSKVEERRRLGL